MSSQTVSTFKKKIKSLEEKGRDWTINEYKTASENLAAIFADLYQLRYNFLHTDTATAQKENCLAELKKACEAKGCKFKRKKPSACEMLIKLAFYDPNANCAKRISSYITAFNAIINDERVNEGNVELFIKERGGVEEIRLAETGGLTRKERLKAGKETLTGMDTIRNYEDDSTRLHGSENGEPVLLVGVQRADGSVAVKQIIRNKNVIKGKVISGKTAIAGALNTTLSVKNAMMALSERELAEKAEAERKQKRKELVESTENNEKTQTETEAA